MRQETFDQQMTRIRKMLVEDRAFQLRTYACTCCNEPHLQFTTWTNRGAFDSKRFDVHASFREPLLRAAEEMGYRVVHSTNHAVTWEKAV